MTTPTKFTLAHISDLHFSGGTDISNPNRKHSIEHLIGLGAQLSKLKLDRLIVSGDISNYGDRQSLIDAHGWLFSSIPIGNGENTGLAMAKDKVGIVPGNHDAWNAGPRGTFVDRRQKSLANYNYAFPSHQIDNSGCYYDWLERDGHGVYIAYVDSCFLGDTEEDSESTFGTVRYDQAVAKGKLTVEQTERLLEWHDKGNKGALETTGELKFSIDREVFAKSLKIIVMHHYLFEPPEKKSDYFMTIQDRDIVFRNIALSDFDILLCGHKHIPAFDVHDYGDHFDRRGVQRYMLNYFRRLIGLESLPIQFTDDSGMRMSKPLTQMIEIVSSWMKRFGITNGHREPPLDDEEIAERVFAILRSGLDSPDDLRRNVERYLQDIGQSGASTLEAGELKRIQKRIAIGFTTKQRKELREVADKISAIASRLKARSFVQIMSGSSAKMPSNLEKRRAFHVHEICRVENGWTVASQRFDWERNAFSKISVPRVHEFPDKF